MNEDQKFLAKFKSDKKAVETRNRTLQRTKHDEDEEFCEVENSLSLHLKSIEKNSVLDGLVSEIHDVEISLVQMMKEIGLKDELDEKICV
ncbi:2219_t:CDS:2 [Acaulospora colombiana]|uniref:2219_t:CDS:1 n=1 Tax=Acaulospora colombiana TaxID=27376 RepID=A0ACA9KX43_9GLOM|nr:2219_t:CDS:2 [Acaulospora colombiana]